MDKNKAVIKFLMNCPTIQENPLFFNFADIEDNSNHVITGKDSTKKSYVDGSFLKQYTFTIACYKSIAHIPIAHIENFKDENIENMAIVQEILDWIDEQADNHNYPDFGEHIIVDDMKILSTDPNLSGVDISVNPPVARYTIGVKISYIDNSKAIWNN